ncbi:ABC transporter ATP-binding protein [Lentimicrobium sp.]
MLEITLHQTEKKYNHQQIFTNLSATLTSGQGTAILGRNGSGKSTLLQIIASAIIPTAGSITYHLNGAEIKPENAFRLMAIAAPYMELIEDFTLKEMVCFHRKLKPLMRNMPAEELMTICYLSENANKPLRFFSSGMKQRLKLALAILSDTPALLLDEPVSNLDAHGMRWYEDLIAQYSSDRLVVISSNSVMAEYRHCNQVIQLEEYKTPLNTRSSSAM